MLVLISHAISTNAQASTLSEIQKRACENHMTTTTKSLTVGRSLHVSVIHNHNSHSSSCQCGEMGRKRTASQKKGKWLERCGARGGEGR